MILEFSIDFGVICSPVISIVLLVIVTLTLLKLFEISSKNAIRPGVIIPEGVPLHYLASNVFY